MNFTEGGGNVTLSASGSIDLGAVVDGDLGTPGVQPAATGTVTTTGPISPSTAVAITSPPFSDFAVYPMSLSSPVGLFGTGGYTFATAASGDIIGIFLEAGTNVYLPDTYVSGSPLSGTATFAGTDFATLGLTPGTYVYPFSNGPVSDSVTINVGPVGGSSVPEPGTMAIFGLLGVGIATGAFRRRRQPDRC